jgi:hypothetical protein
MHTFINVIMHKKLYKGYGSNKKQRLGTMLRGRRRHGTRGRMPKPIWLGNPPPTSRFFPFPQTNPTPIYLEPAELESLRLVDLEGLSQEDAGTKMGISRGTVWRLLQSARKKVTQSLTEGKQIIIAP